MLMLHAFPTIVARHSGRSPGGIRRDGGCGSAGCILALATCSGRLAMRPNPSNSTKMRTG